MPELTKPSKKNVKVFLDKVRETIKVNKRTPTGQLIGMLSPIISGWARDHRHVVSMATFSSSDHAIFQALWRWAKRRHPKKRHRWIKAKYVATIGSNHWVFHGVRNGKDLTLFRASRVSIRRHVKVRAAANPFDPSWEIYFEQRLGVKMVDNLKGRRQLLRRWKEQDDSCPVCNQTITELTGWHNDHIIWRCHGGPDTAVNLVFLRPTCHNQVHSHGL